MKITPSRPPRHQSIPRPLIPWCESNAFALRTHRCDLRAFLAMGVVGMGTDTLHLDFSTRLCCRRKLTCSLHAHFPFGPRVSTGSWVIEGREPRPGGQLVYVITPSGWTVR